MTALKSSSAERNKTFILDVLRGIVSPEKITALEIASGTGQHVTFFAEHLKQVSWQPSECNNTSIESIGSYLAVSRLSNVSQPVWIDTTEPVEHWANGVLTSGSWDIMLCINMMHIAEWAVTEGLFRGGGHYLKPNGALVTYGPCKVDGVITPESNVQFDRMLRQQNAAWGLRDINDLQTLAKENQMILEKTVDMPANNRILVFRKTDVS